MLDNGGLFSDMFGCLNNHVRVVSQEHESTPSNEISQAVMGDVRVRRFKSLQLYIAHF